MKRFFSIFLILLFGFAGASSIAHQLEQEETHAHEEGTHLCVPDAHHYCSLCDTLLSFGFITTYELITQAVVWNYDYTPLPSSIIYPCVNKDTLGRAPPMV